MAVAPTRVRPLSTGDIAAARPMARRSLDGVSRRLDLTPQLSPAETPESVARGVARFEHVLDRDPRGAWLAVSGDDEPVGACLAIRRGGLWMLSLLAVEQDHQGEGIGRLLLERGLAYAEGSTGGLICVSRDPRAMRRYHRAGFALHPCFSADGPLDRSLLPAGLGIRDGDPARDRDLVEALAIRQRGYGLGLDLGWQVDRMQCQLLVVEESGRGGFALVREGRLEQLAADDDELASRLAMAALASAPGACQSSASAPEAAGQASAGAPGADQCRAGQATAGEAEMNHITGRQQWAIDVAMALRLPLRMDGAVATKGALGPLSPYLPSGIWG